ncbi:hypothetical protein F4804DRAFT_349911 [Jackrogersella minutella]|nr:hypothetical protein F4804DRAFT_349911 [Jackrogersella minutella]
MDNTDLYMSNCTCFYGLGQVADPNCIPCGHAALMGPWFCCYAGDFCLSSTACWDNDTSVIYVAECTDSTFTSAKCTNKFHYPDQQYVVIARCEGDDSDIWSRCSADKDWTAISKEPDCTCTASGALIRNPNGKSSFDPIGSLPLTTGGIISFNPTEIPTLGSTSRGPYSAPETSSTSMATTSPVPVEDTSQGLSSGAKVGVGVGVGASVPFVAALVFIALILAEIMKTIQQNIPHIPYLSAILRRRKSARAAPVAVPDPALQDERRPEDPQNNAAEAMEGKASSPEKEITTTPEPPNPGWYGYKPELPANSTFKSELSGDEPQNVMSSSWNSATLDSNQTSELSNHDAVTSAAGRSSLE